MPTLTCHVCGKEFETTTYQANNGRKYCSRECSAEGYKKKRIPKTCECCGEDFEVLPSRAYYKYCSQDCRNSARSEQMSGKENPLWDRVELTCPECGKSFYVKRSRADVRVHCSRECDAKAKAKVNGKAHPNWSRKERTCLTCEETFYRKPSHIKRFGGKYCSRECYTQGRKYKAGEEHPNWNREDVDCAACGTVFSVAQWEIEAGRKYCSRQCAFGGDAATDIEIATRNILKQFGLRYREQVQIGRYAVDFLLPAFDLVIECDGVYWHSTPEVQAKDRRKDSYLESEGYTVCRIRGDEIRENAFRAVIQALR